MKQTLLTHRADEAGDYFNDARSWHDDLLETARLNARRWFCAFCAAGVLAILLTACLIVLMPLKELVPIVIHQNTQTGEIWVDKPSHDYQPETPAQTQADIVRYVTNRESYSAVDINQRFNLVMLLSNPDVAGQYSDSQANSDPQAPVNTLGEKGLRLVHVEDVVFMDKSNPATPPIRHFHQAPSNLAKVDFTTETTDKSGAKSTQYWVATIGWTYKGLPKNKEDAWDNWNGFVVTTYRVDQRNVTASQ